ncbi:hypothetical protein LCGC14_2301350, partial [marine sediment metagenome]
MARRSAMTMGFLGPLETGKFQFAQLGQQ